MKNLSEIKEYNFNLKKFILDLQEELEENENIIKKANAIDVEITKKMIELQEIKNILDKYKNSNLSNRDISQNLVIYSGHPYLTVNILLQAIIAKSQVLLLTDEFMLGVNTIICSIFKKVLKKYKIDNFFENEENYSVKDIQILANKYKEIIVIGDSTTMQLLDNLQNAKFYPNNNIILYSDDDKYEKLQRIIYKYAEENQFEIEIIYDTQIQDVIEIINADRFADIIILLSKNKDTQEIFKKIDNKKVFINNNPFDSKAGTIYNYFNV